MADRQVDRSDPHEGHEPETEFDAIVESLGADEIDTEAIRREERAASRRLSAIEAGRRKGGLAGAAMAGVMLTLHEIYEGPDHDDDIVEVSESPDEPGDIDVDGISVTVGDVDYLAPPPPPRSPSANDDR